MRWQFIVAGALSAERRRYEVGMVPPQLQKSMEPTSNFRSPGCPPVLPKIFESLILVEKRIACSCFHEALGVFSRKTFSNFRVEFFPVSRMSGSRLSIVSRRFDPSIRI